MGNEKLEHTYFQIPDIGELGSGCLRFGLYAEGKLDGFMKLS